MTKSDTCVIFIQEQTWRIGLAGPEGVQFVDLVIPEDADVDRLADLIAESVDKAEVSELVLALPSAWCLCASIEGRPEGRGWRRELLFELEEQLPVSAEDIVGDFILLDDRCIGVCTETSHLNSLIDAIESRGFFVGSICPAALLALQNRMKSADAREANIMLWAAGEHIDMFMLKNGKPIAWHMIPAEPDDVATRLKMLAYSYATEQISLLGDSVGREIIERCSAMPNVQLMPESEPAGDLYHQAWDTVSQLSDGKLKPIVDLRRDALASKHQYRKIKTPLTAAVVCLVFMLMVVGGSLFWMSHQYIGHVGVLRHQLNADYKRGLPEGRPTERTSVMVKELEDELSILQAQSGNASGIIETSSALRILVDLVNSFPPKDQVHFRLVKLRISGNDVRMEGEAQTHQDAGKISEAISRSGKFNMQPPRTTSLRDRGVNFTMTGDYIGGDGGVGRRR